MMHRMMDTDIHSLTRSYSLTDWVLVDIFNNQHDSSS